MQLFIFILGLSLLAASSGAFSAAMIQWAQKTGKSSFFLRLLMFSVSIALPGVLYSIIALRFGQSESVVGIINGGIFIPLFLVAGVIGWFREWQSTKTAVSYEPGLLVFISFLYFIFSQNDGKIIAVEAWMVLLSFLIGMLIHSFLIAGKKEDIAAVLAKMERGNRLTGTGKIVALGLVAGLAGIITGSIIASSALEKSTLLLVINERLLGKTFLAFALFLPGISYVIYVVKHQVAYTSINALLWSAIAIEALLTGIVPLFYRIPVAKSAYETIASCGVASLLFYILVHYRGRLSRIEGTFLLIGYMAYMIFVH